MKKLIILEMANNHMGDIEHGRKLIRAFGKITKKYDEFDFAIKFQYRDLDTFIHPSMKDRLDLKFIKRFAETRIDKEQFQDLIQECRDNDLEVLSTPFDEKSVEIIEDQNLSYIKIASCSFGDWPLMERIALSDKPIIASTAGASSDLIDQVSSFFINRNRSLTIMHCVGEYPTQDEKMHVGQIAYLKNRYPECRVGFSSHENPDNFDIVKLAASMGAEVFEKHVGLPSDQYSNNDYSVNPQQLDHWLSSLKWTCMVIGESKCRSPANKNEQDSLRGLRRGVFVLRDIDKGEEITESDVYFAFPPVDGQITSIEWSKYSSFVANRKIKKDDDINYANTSITDNRRLVLEATRSVSKFIEESDVVIPKGIELELSHHYGIENFYENGLTLITVVNREYCKKLLISLPGQRHPEQFHKQKEETFHVLHGNVRVKLDGNESIHGPGSVINILPLVRHEFISDEGSILEEISSTHYPDDSYYTDEIINKNKSRKTIVSNWRGL